MSLIKTNKNIEDAILRFNQLDSQKGEVILHKIFASPTSDYSQLFSEKELQKLLSLLQIEEEELENIVKAFSFLLLHAVAERNIRDVEFTLSHIGISAAHLASFSAAWLKHGNQYTLEIREKPIAIQQELKDFNWAITLLLDSSKLPLKTATHLRKDSRAIENNEELYSIDVKNPAIILNTLLHQEEGQKEQKFAFRLEKAQLQNFFENIEKIQEQLDLL